MKAPYRKILDFIQNRFNKNLKNSFLLKTRCLTICSFLPFCFFSCSSSNDKPEDRSHFEIKNNTPPIANPGRDQTVLENIPVTLAGTGIDEDIHLLTYTWKQVSGLSVELTNTEDHITTFIAPSVVDTETLIFELNVKDAYGASDTSTISVTILDTLNYESPTSVRGNVYFDDIPHDEKSNGLNYNLSTKKSVRGATVEAIDATDRVTIIASSKTDRNGFYYLNVPSDTEMFMRVKAELKQGGAASWDFKVLDNTNGNALYALEGETFNSQQINSTQDLYATSGWSDHEYKSPRASAPFAILDAAYQCLIKVLNENKNIQLSALKFFWSPLNRASESINPRIGEIGTSHYNGNREIYILGAEDNDTDEYDPHVIIHEWAHYLEDTLSRSDSIGGKHHTNGRLDMRLAFGEGFANAFSAIILENPNYKDSYGNQQKSGGHNNIENNDYSNSGWYNEGSIQSILYDLYDKDDDGADSISLEFKSIYDVLTKDQINTPGVTSIFSFIHYLKTRNPEMSSNIDTLVNYQNINSSSIDEFGSSENNDAENGSLVLPVYTNLIIASPPILISTTNQFGTSNKLSNYRFFKVEIPKLGKYQIHVKSINLDDSPNIKILRNGKYVGVNTRQGPEKSLTLILEKGVHCLILNNASSSGQKKSQKSNYSTFKVNIQKLISI